MRRGSISDIQQVFSQVTAFPSRLQQALNRPPSRHAHRSAAAQPCHKPPGGSSNNLAIILHFLRPTCALSLLLHCRHFSVILRPHPSLQAARIFVRSGVLSSGLPTGPPLGTSLLLDGLLGGHLLLDLLDHLQLRIKLDLCQSLRAGQVPDHQSGRSGQLTSLAATQGLSGA